VGSYTSRRFFWRGETYHFAEGGVIIPESRGESAAVGRPPLWSESERAVLPKPRPQTAQHPNLRTDAG